MMSAVLDRVDGDLARLTGRLSRMGHRLDLVADCGGDALLFLAMGLGARHGGLGWGAVVLGVGAAIGVGLLFWHFNAGTDASQGASVVRLVDPDDTMLAVPLAAVLVGLSPIVLIAGIAAPLAASVLIVRAARARREAALRPTTALRTPARLQLSDGERKTSFQAKQPGTMAL